MAWKKYSLLRKNPVFQAEYEPKVLSTCLSAKANALLARALGTKPIVRKETYTV